MHTPDEIERQHTLRTAAARYEELWGRYAFADGDGQDEEVADRADPLTSAEALELLALGEALARKARYGRQLAVRAAREAGASWSRIGRAVGTSKQTAWEAHTRWIDQQTRLHHHSGYQGLDETQAARARALAGAAEEAEASDEDEDEGEAEGEP